MPRHENAQAIRFEGMDAEAGYREPEPLTVLSWGAGPESTAILLKLLFDPAFREWWAPGRLVICMSDTGDEHQATLDHVSEMKRLCETHGVEFFFLKAGGPYHTAAWPDLISFYKRNNAIGAKAYPKSCSANLKVSVFYRWLEHYLSRHYGVAHGKKRGILEYAALAEPVCVLIGIAEGEEKRLSKKDGAPKWMKQAIQRNYPLLDLAWDRSACQNYIRSLGFTVPVPSLCRRCPFKGSLEIPRMSKAEPEAFREWVQLEANKLAVHAERFPHLPRHKNFGVFGLKTLPRVLAEAENEHGHLTVEQLETIRMQGHGVASAY